ncbi:NAD-dependent epimerase/dehydratase family protein [candidate division KSB1 bacterium]
MIKDEVLRSFSGSNVLVTGGTGMVGRAIVDILCNAGANVRIVSLDKIKVNDKAEHVYGDLTSLEFCKDVTKDMDFVFQVAGIKGSIVVAKERIASHFVPTLMFTTNVLEACRINKVKKVVYTSSIGSYTNAEIFKEPDNFDTPDKFFDGPPMDFAGWAKRMGELQIYAYKVQYKMENFAIVRPCNIYGPGDNFDPDNAMVIPSLMYRISDGEDPLLVWGDGSAIRDFAFSGDVAEGCILALHHGTKGGFVNLSSGKGVSIKQLVEALNSFIDFRYEFDVSKPSGFPVRIMDISLAKEIIDFNPTTTLEEGLETTWKWFHNNKEEFKKRKNYFAEE